MNAVRNAVFTLGLLLIGIAVGGCSKASVDGGPLGAAAESPLLAPFAGE